VEFDLLCFDSFELVSFIYFIGFVSTKSVEGVCVVYPVAAVVMHRFGDF